MPAIAKVILDSKSEDVTYMANVNLDFAISQLAAEGVERALAPYRDVLKKMARLVEGGVVGAGQPVVAKRGPGRPPASAKALPPKPVRRVIPQNAVKMVSNFQVGQKVSYKQGKGSFGATVIEIDANQGMLKLKREADSKEIERPASKVYKA